MNKKQKDNLIKALQEVNAPDKEELLDRIEQKKNFRKEYEKESKLIMARSSNAKSMRRLVTACIAGAFVFVAVITLVIASVLAMFKSAANSPSGGNSSVVDGTKDYRNDWDFRFDYKQSFDDVDITLDKYCKDNNLEWMYDYQDGWVVTKTQFTQDENSYREYYKNGEYNVEVTIFTKRSKIPATDTRYEQFLNFENRKTCSDNIVYYGNLVLENSPYEYVYVIYKEDAVYVLYADKELFGSVLK